MSIPHLREALDSLEDRMATLLNERERLETRLEHAVRMQSPVQRLPSELLASIFVNGVFDQGEEDAVLLANIMLACRYWREVAVGTPALWSRIFMGPRRSLDRARLKLERSKSFPLHICVDFSPQSEHRTVATETLMHAMDLLRSAMWRWRSFQLSVPERPQAHAALSRCKEEAPLLEVFSVRIANSMQHDDRHPGQPLFLFAGRTPRLRSCAFNSYNFGWDPRLASGLRVLKLSGYWNNAAPSLDDLLAILRASPQLEELALRNMSDVDQGACGVTDIDPDRPIRVADSRTVYLPRLTRASFYYAGPLRVRTLLSLLTFPALERIELGYMDDVSAIVEYLRRQSLTSLPLRHLKIESCLFNEFKLVSLLMRFTSLATLELIDVEDVSSYTLRSLATPQLAQPWLCQKLTSINLEGCTGFEWEALRSFVESRLPAQSRAFPRQLGTSPGPLPRQISTSSSISSSSAAASALVRSQTLGGPTSTSSASAFASQAHILARTPVTPATNPTLRSLGWPERVQSINLTRCGQISREMVQWLRMYVETVRCETVKGVWGEHVLA
ncbi:hypothetical protein CERSUDRAFT_80909 [Gelatoporia subvermispora B]|uniref:F-box domain-containing protein n=1 Tax=Ceriporiopsis subvermispora (strain B) TaxID=914234 RepID=M2QR22_CERS8|nr:hypothetical protein CERSUDRAFT_80909 [Gelatoporia subvermispora B]